MITHAGQTGTQQATSPRCLALRNQTSTLPLESWGPSSWGLTLPATALHFAAPNPGLVPLEQGLLSGARDGSMDGLGRDQEPLET